MSGIILHTGLGRARLGKLLTDSVIDSLSCHTDLELDLDSGKRGNRQDHVRGLLQELTGAEDALVVNNCAGALFLTLKALCENQEVILSRGQMVEIGGSFRMPDIVRESGCSLVETGCTNKTKLSDYGSAMTENTAALLRCHPSNFRVIGFSEEPTAQEIAHLAHANGLLLIDDVGHGCLTDLSIYGLPRERTLKDAITDGADVVLASADKLLGGPQAGLILGSSELVAKIGSHPLARALRIDKLSLTVLIQVLLSYAENRSYELPIWQSASKPLVQVKKEARKIAASYAGKSLVSESQTQMGGGSMPERGITTFRAGLVSSDPEALMRQLRKMSFPVIGRIEDGTVWLDPRTAVPEEIQVVCTQLKQLAQE